MPHASRCLEERVWQLSLTSVAAPPAVSKTWALPRTQCDTHSSLAMEPSVQLFDAAIAKSLTRMRSTVEEAAAAVLPAAVYVDYEIRDHVMFADVDVGGVFRFTRTPLLLRKGEANWLLTVPVLGAESTSARIVLRAKKDPTLPPLERTGLWGAQPQFLEFEIQGFTVVLVVNAADSRCARYSREARAAELAAGHLQTVVRHLSALVNNHTLKPMQKTVAGPTLLQSLLECDSTLREARDWTRRWRSTVCCDADSPMIQAMAVQFNDACKQDWTITEDDVRASVDFGQSVPLLDDVRCAAELVPERHAEGALCLSQAYERTRQLKDTYVDMKSMSALMLPQAPDSSYSLGLRELLEQRQEVMAEILLQVLADKTSNYQKPLNRVLYLTLNCIDSCLCFVVDDLCGIQSQTHDVCLHGRQLRRLGLLLPNEGPLVARGLTYIAQAMRLRRTTARAPPAFLTSDVMQQLWKTKILGLVEEMMYKYVSYLENHKRNTSSTRHDRDICRIARRHNEYYAKMHPPRVQLETLALQVCADTRWSQIFKIIVFGDLQMQVIRSRDTMRALMQVAEHRDDFFENPLILEYMQTHKFIELLTCHMAGWDIPAEDLERNYREYTDETQ